MSTGPLEGLDIDLPGHGVAEETAAWLLSTVGATVSAAPGRATMRHSPIRCPTGGVPTGTVDYTAGVALAVGALAAHWSGTPVEVSELGVAIQVFLPEVMSVAYGAPPPEPPPPPVPAPGGGWLACDLGAPGAMEDFEILSSTLPAGADAPTVASAAQEWRLPCCDYRRRRAAEREPPVLVTMAEPRAASEAGRLDEVQICDLTAMWAGPLATWLLMKLGATVHKVEPSSRLDGTRGLDGKGIYPGGQQRHAGEDSAIWNALNAGKLRAALDINDPIQGSQLLDLAGTSDVVIDSFSPRVMRNFGVNLAAGALTASMPAFAPGPMRDWVAYGTGAHAVSGLGDCGAGVFEAPLVAYPDPVAGFTAAFAVLAGLVGAARGRPASRVEVPLASAIQPLLAFEAEPPGGDELERGALLFDAGMAGGEFAAQPVGGMQLMHPTGPFAVGG